MKETEKLCSCTMYMNLTERSKFKKKLFVYFAYLIIHLSNKNTLFVKKSCFIHMLDDAQI